MSGEEDISAIRDEATTNSIENNIPSTDASELTDALVAESLKDVVETAPSDTSDLFDALTTDEVETEPVSVPTDELADETQISLEKERLMDNVEETMRALQAEDESTEPSPEEESENNDPTEFVQVSNTKNNKEAEPMEICEDPIAGGNNQLDEQEDSLSSLKDQEKTTEPLETDEPSPENDDNVENDEQNETVNDETVTADADDQIENSGESIIPDTEREITQAEKDAATSAKTSKSNGSSLECGDEPAGSGINENNVEGVGSIHLTDDSNSNGSAKIHFDQNALTTLTTPVNNICKQCNNSSECQFKYDTPSKEEIHFCNETCYKTYFNIMEPPATLPGDEESSSPAGSAKSTTSADKSSNNTDSQRNKFKLSRDKNAIREPLVYERKCNECKKEITSDDRNLTWECMEFCNEDCIAKFQTNIGSKCANCKDCVPLPSLGKYCVRFGYDIRQFCSSSCLEDFKKGLKVCSYCQKDISGGVEGFLAPVGNKGQFKDFCTQSCMEKYDQMSNNHAPKRQVAQCAVCSNEKSIRLEIEVEGIDHKLCSEPCFVAFKFANNVSPEQCHMCQKYFEQTTLDYTIYFDDNPHHFCSKTCQNVYIISNRKIVPCQWCKVKKYNFDMIKKNCKTGNLMMCSINCLALYQVSVNAVSARKTNCDHCALMSQAQYHLTMSDATIRNFCSYQCVMNFQNQFSKSPITIANTPISAAALSQQQQNEKVRTSVAVPAGQPKRTYSSRQTRSSGVSTESSKSRKSQHQQQPSDPQLPIITSVHSLAPAQDPPAKSSPAPQTNGPTSTRSSKSSSKSSTPSSVSQISSSKNSSLKQPPPLQPLAKPSQSKLVSTQVQTEDSGRDTPSPPPAPKPKYVQQFLVKPPTLPEIKNKSTMCKPNMHTKGVSFKPHMTTKETQTDESLAKTVIIPVPVPIYVPTPMSLYSMPFPVPVPFPLPVPIPIFIPTTRNSATGIMKEIKKIQVKIPTDPFEAELLMMAEMVAGDKKVENTDSESDDDDHGGGGGGNEGGFSPEAVDTSNTFGDDMLQMALKMATELDEPAVDLEGALTANTITASQSQDTHEEEDDNQQMHHHHAMMEARGGGRGSRKRHGGRTPRGTGGKRGRRMSGHDIPMMPPPTQAVVAPPPPEPVEKPDANMCLKYTFGVNAWKQWVTTKNSELEKSTLSLKPFKSEILQLTADELNYSLCLFVKEVRKPNGSEYAPDTIYYLCLGIQQYLFENGRIDNIFTDAFYEKFTECLDEVARKFSVLYNDSHYIVTRVEEEHLWESKQLGAHSPHVLLSTLMFFNTKHFNLTTVDEHMQLSFSHIMKHWKRNPNQPGASKGPGSRNVLLRFYPPQSSQLVGDAAEASSRKKKVYEQQENEENPLRCPVKLYEFYLSKCPESVKTRNDVFYLLPERSCVPDSPVWYSTMALGRTALEKMLHRVKMVKEINVALLTS